MTEPQDVLADLLRRLDGWAGDAATRYERADEMVDVARRELRAALVRTPETHRMGQGRWLNSCVVDDEPWPCSTARSAATPETLDEERLRAALVYGVERQLGPGSAINFDSAIGSAVAEYVRLAATPSPTPPEGRVPGQVDIDIHGVEYTRFDSIENAASYLNRLSASPAPDPGAGAGPLFIDSLARAMAKYRDGDAGRWLDHVMEAAQLVAVYAVPSAEPPETA